MQNEQIDTNKLAFAMEMTLQQGVRRTPGFLILQNGQLRFMTDQENISIGSTKQSNVVIHNFGIQVITDGQTYHFTKGADSISDTLRDTYSKDVSAEEIATTRALLLQTVETTGDSDLIDLYDDGKFTLAMWDIILRASGANIDTKSLSSVPRKHTKLHNLTIVIILVLCVAVLATLVILLRVYISSLHK